MRFQNTEHQSGTPSQDISLMALSTIAKEPAIEGSRVYKEHMNVEQLGNTMIMTRQYLFVVKVPVCRNEILVSCLPLCTINWELLSPG